MFQPSSDKRGSVAVNHEQLVSVPITFKDQITVNLAFLHRQTSKPRTPPCTVCPFRGKEYKVIREKWGCIACIICSLSNALITPVIPMIYTYSISSFMRFLNAWSWINWRRFSFSNLKCKLKAEVLSVEDLHLRKKGGAVRKQKGVG